MKIAKIIVKYTPITIAIFYFIFVILSCFGIGLYWITPICYLSLIPLFCIHECSRLLKFCIWHRLPLYYSIAIDIINAIDYYFVIPLVNKYMFGIYLTITILFILIGMYLKEKYNRLNKREH